MCERFSWKALRAVVLESPFYDPGTDSVATQRDIIAASVAIADRMTIAVREVSWTPVRILERRETPWTRDNIQRRYDEAWNNIEGDGPGGALVPLPVPPPNKPRGGLAASRQVEESLAW